MNEASVHLRCNRWCRDDLAQAVELGRAEARATGCDEREAVGRALYQTYRDLSWPRGTVRSGDLGIDFDVLPESSRLGGEHGWRIEPPPAGWSEDRKTRHYRNQVIVLCASNGVSQRVLARIFGLSRIQVQQIIGAR